MGEERMLNVVADAEKFIYYTYELRKNQITGDLEIDGRSISNVDLNTIIIACKKKFPKISSQTVGEILYSNSTPSYDPFKIFFDGAPEGHYFGNLEKLIASIETDTPNHGLFIKKWMVGMVRSAYEGKHSPLCLILCGGQNTGKTEWFRRLLPPELSDYFAECKFDYGKDDEALMAKKLILLDDEMSGKSKTEEAQLKNRTSKQSITLRLPYDKIPTTLNRISMLCGTTNETDVLSDPTGNRRFLPINVTKINHEHFNSINKANLLHECLHELRVGYNPDLTKEDIEVLNNSTQGFEATCPVEETIDVLFRPTTSGDFKIEYLTGTQIMNSVNGEILGRPTVLKKIKSTLLKLGYGNPTKTTRHGTSGRYYEVVRLAA
jgi:predicted P-loop ATPase